MNAGTDRDGTVQDAVSAVVVLFVVLIAIIG